MKPAILLALTSSILPAAGRSVPPGGMLPDWRVSDEASCQGQQLQYSACNKGPCDGGCTPVHCQMNDWHDWGVCKCDGLRDRSRTIQVHNNECGKPCDASTHVTGRCGAHCGLKSATDCVFGDWEEWAACPPDSYQTFRNRRIVTQSEHGGAGCIGEVKETKDCPAGPDEPEDKACLWSDWATWSACTCPCDGGQRSRDRHITQAPRGNGARCKAWTKSEVASCNTQSCSVESCQDGAWSPWENWQICTASCGGGTTWRRRSVAVEADHCGVPATGKDAESKPCNTQSCHKDVDCELSQWMPWSACSCPCEGVQRRARHISQYGRGDGKWCMGATKQIQGCNNFEETPNCAPTSEKPVDCQLAKWGEWSTCTATCGVGQRTKSRNIITDPSNGGAPCDTHLEVTEPCNLQPCNTVDSTPCEYMDWSEWGACDKCGGQKKRTRGILKMPENGGAECQLAASEMTAKCDRLCHEPLFCEWGKWTDHGACSTTCGAGVVKRRRTLGHVDKLKALEEVSASSLYQTAALEDGQYAVQDVFVSFACGGFVTFFVLFAGLRVLRVQQGRTGHDAMDVE